jgi:protein-disulfide isomerase
MTTVNAHPNPEDIMAWSDQELDAAAAARVRVHVDDCASCRSIADELRNVRARADQWRVELAPSAVRAAVLSAAVRDQLASPVSASGALPGFWQRYRWQLVAASLVIAAVFVGGQVSLCGEVICRIRQSEPQPAEASVQVPTSIEVQAVWQGGPRVDLGIPDDGAAVVVAWVVDYECPACALNDPLFTMLSLQYAASNPGQVKFVVEPWPWNSECNPNLTITLPGHEASCTAAVAMRLAKTRGTAETLQTWLFRHQPATSAEVREAAASIGGITDFDAQYPAQLAAVRARLTALAPAGIHATPTCFVNGMLVNDATGHVSVPMVKMAIASELQRVGKR